METIPFNSLPREWIVEKVSQTETHVYPDNDWRIHTLTGHCLCDPHVNYQFMGRQIVHNSFDSRETDEEHRPWKHVN